jgi:hypothetical protein
VNINSEIRIIKIYSRNQKEGRERGENKRIG